MTTAVLPADDQQFLERAAPGATVEVESGMTCIVIPEFPLPGCFSEEHADLLIRLSPGYPDVAPDMWWFSPPVLRTDGRAVPATESSETIVGRHWQRWSRHFTPGAWLSGTDGLESYVALVKAELQRASQ